MKAIAGPDRGVFYSWTALVVAFGDDDGDVRLELADAIGSLQAIEP